MCWGVLARVVRIEGLSAEVDFGGVRRTVVLGADDVGEGDFVLVHAGIVIGKVSQRAMAENLEVCREMLVAGLVEEGVPREEAVRRAGEILESMLGGR
jgi:hydrogenase expression/formation protein HypC